jgi:glycine/D-amino acid oxidase-like deaminating enzyme
VFKTAESWYEATAQRKAYPVLVGHHEADVCVIGGGLAGLTTARECQARGFSVILLEAARLAGAASGRNGGFVSNGFALGVDKIVARVGLDQARALHALSRRGTDYIQAVIAANDPSLLMGQGMRVVLRHRDDGGLKAYGDMLRETFAEEVAYSGVDESRRNLDSARYFESLYFPKAFHIHPLRYGLAVAGLAEQKGARLFENSPALACEGSAGKFVVRTAQGEVQARHVVHCVSSLDARLHRATGRSVLPVATYVAVTEPLDQNVIRTTSAVADTRRAGDYYRLLPDGRLMWGGRITTRVSEPGQLANLMRGDIVSVFPSLGQPKIDYAWSGLMAYARHMMPLIGRDAAGQWYATGFGGHGLNTTTMAGLLVAEGIAGAGDDWRRFSAFPPLYGFGPLGRIGVQGRYWWMQLRDRLDESKGRHRPR